VENTQQERRAANPELSAVEGLIRGLRVEIDGLRREVEGLVWRVDALERELEASRQVARDQAAAGART